MSISSTSTQVIKFLYVGFASLKGLTKNLVKKVISVQQKKNYTFYYITVSQLTTKIEAKTYTYDIYIEKSSTVIVLKFCTPKFYKMAYANSVDPDQTAPEGAV